MGGGPVKASPSDGLESVANAAAARKAKFLIVQMGGITDVETSYAAEAGAHLAMVADDPISEREASAGPTAFHDVELRLLLDGATAIVCSSAIGEAEGSMIAGFITAARVPRFVLVLTRAENHAAWCQKVLELSGAAPSIHVAASLADTGLQPARAQASVTRVLH